MFQGGDLWPAIIFTQDGVIGTGYLEEGLKRLLTPVLDPDLEVYLLDESSSTSIAVKKTWSELKALYLAKRAGGE